jgi:hypothetical protein
MTSFSLSLGVSAVALAIIMALVRFVRNGRKALMGITICGVIAMFVSGGSSAVTLQVVLVGVLATGVYSWSWRYSAYVITAISLSGLVYVLGSILANNEIASYRDRRERYAQEFLSERIPPVKKTAGSKGPNATAQERLQDLENQIGSSTQEMMMRWMALRSLHERRMETFVNNSGFGVRRILSVPTEQLVKAPEMAEPLPQPGTLGEMEWSDSVIATKPAGVSEGNLTKLHLDGVLNFVNPRGFGYVTAQKQLFGFQPHHFRDVPKADAWQVHTLELVSLLLHDVPKVYVTMNLPRMDKIRDIPTRSLDLFETTGLAKLQAGEDLFIRVLPRGIRMLGAVRSVKQCVECHGGERGDLLGAFSYSLQRMP